MSEGRIDELYGEEGGEGRGESEVVMETTAITYDLTPHNTYVRRYHKSSPPVTSPD